MYPFSPISFAGAFHGATTDIHQQQQKLLLQATAAAEVLPIDQQCHPCSIISSSSSSYSCNVQQHQSAGLPSSNTIPVQAQRATAAVTTATTPAEVLSTEALFSTAAPSQSHKPSSSSGSKALPPAAAAPSPSHHERQQQQLKLQQQQKELFPQPQHHPGSVTSSRR